MLVATALLMIFGEECVGFTRVGNMASRFEPGQKTSRLGRMGEMLSWEQGHTLLTERLARLLMNPVRVGRMLRRCLERDAWALLNVSPGRLW